GPRGVAAGDEPAVRGLLRRCSQALVGASGKPAVEVSDTPEAVIVKAQVPGVPKDKLQLTITEDALTLKGEMQEEEKKEDKDYYRREFHYGAFARTIPLPVPVQAEKATAALKDGLLEVTLPKSKEAK